VKITVRISGGFANVKRAVTVDTATLPPEEAAELEAHVAAAGLDRLPPVFQAGRRGGADRLQYELTIERAGKALTLRAEEAALPVAVRQLIDEVRRLARSKQATARHRPTAISPG
jgi:hypothetical protein